MRISLVAAMSENRVIGRDNDIPWRIPKEQKRFHNLTMGKTVIMGRKTFESIGKSLPGRRNIVISHNPSYKAEGCEVVNSLNEALALTCTEQEVFIGGGETIYREALPKADLVYLTTIHFRVEGDTFFPEIGTDFRKVESNYIDGEPPYTYEMFERI